jgi:hypothetical protein
VQGGAGSASSVVRLLPLAVTEKTGLRVPMSLLLRYITHIASPRRTVEIMIDRLDGTLAPKRLELGPDAYNALVKARSARFANVQARRNSPSRPIFLPAFEPNEASLRAESCRQANAL